jgi:predicted RNA-binding Zn-ribbon protein involved in translation (DUF1610 family)
MTLDRRRVAAMAESFAGYPIECPQHGRVVLTAAEFERQLDQVGPWRCPSCGAANASPAEAARALGRRGR